MRCLIFWSVSFSATSVEVTFSGEPGSLGPVYTKLRIQSFGWNPKFFIFEKKIGFH